MNFQDDGEGAIIAYNTFWVHHIYSKNKAMKFMGTWSTEELQSHTTIDIIYTRLMCSILLNDRIIFYNIVKKIVRF